eukprot:m.308552 g.308552  ORF g.308552 m.308552 type:complete len:207 (+) comp44211_c0_seq1:120-740(+)
MSRSSTREAPLEDGRHQQVEVEGLFRAFVSARQPHQKEQDIQEEAKEEDIQEQAEAASPVVETRAEIAGRLVGIADEIDGLYKDDFSKMIDDLKLTPENAYRSFASVAKRLVYRGINWGNIIALFAFGYHVVQKFAKSVTKIISMIAGIIGRFMVREKIGQWVQEQGGWRSVLSLGTADLFPGNNTAFYLLAGMAVAAAILYFTRK